MCAALGFFSFRLLTHQRNDRLSHFPPYADFGRRERGAIWWLRGCHGGHGHGQHCVTSISAAARVIASLLVASFQLLSASPIFCQVLFTLLSFSRHLLHTLFAVQLDQITADFFSPHSGRSSVCTGLIFIYLFIYCCALVFDTHRPEPAPRSSAK